MPGCFASTGVAPSHAALAWTVVNLNARDASELASALRHDSETKVLEAAVAKKGAALH